MLKKRSEDTKIWEKVLPELKELLKEPIPPYSVIGVELIIHAGNICRIRTKKEVQVAVQKEGFE